MAKINISKEMYVKKQNRERAKSDFYKLSTAI